MRFPLHKLSFSNGEINDKTLARVDTSAYAQSVARAHNFEVAKDGPAMVRKPFVATSVKDTDETFSVPYKRSKDDSFIIKIHPDGYIYGVDKNGVRADVFTEGDVFPALFSEITSGPYAGKTAISSPYIFDWPITVGSWIEGLDSGGTYIWDAYFLDYIEGGSGSTLIAIDEDWSNFNSNGWGASTENMRIRSFNRIFNPANPEIPPWSKFSQTVNIKDIQYVQQKGTLYLVHAAMRTKAITVLDDGFSLNVRDVTFIVDDRTTPINGPYAEEGGDLDDPVIFHDGEFPHAIAIYEQRLILGLDDDMYFSELGELERFETDDGAAPPVVTDANAFVRTPSSREGFKIRWIEGGQKFISIGTTADTLVCTAASEYGTITPFSINFRVVSRIGAELMMAQESDGRIFYSERGARRLSYVQFSSQVRSHITRDSTAYKEQITQGNIKRIQYKRNAETSEVFLLKENGEIVVLVLNPQQENEGFYRILPKQGHTFTDICVIYDENGVDTLFVQSLRDGDYFMEFMEHEREVLTLDDFFTGDKEQDLEDFRIYAEEQQFKDARLDLNQTFFEDIPHDIFFEERSGLYYFYVQVPDYFTDLNAASSIIGRTFMLYGVPMGYEILGVSEGMGNSYIQVDISNGMPQKSSYGPVGCFGIETLDVPLLNDGTYDGVIDGKDVELEVISGEVTLSETVKVAHIGHKYFSFLKIPLDYASSDVGLSLFNGKSLSELDLNVWWTGPFKYGVDLNALEISEAKRTNLTQAPPFRTDDLFEVAEDNMESLAFYYIVQDRPFPLNIRNVAAIIEGSRR